MLKSRFTSDVHCPTTKSCFGVTFIKIEQNNYKPKSIKNHTRWFIILNGKKLRNLEKLTKIVRSL